MDVLITHSYFLRFDQKQWKAQRPYPPLATLFAASTLRSNQFEIGFFDPMFSATADEILPLLVKHKPKLLLIYDDGFNYLTKMCLTNMRDAAMRMAQLAQELGIKVAISSSDSTDHSLSYLQSGIDFIIVGEGEQTALELASNLIRSEKQIEEIAGLRLLENGLLRSTKPRQNLRDLDSLPLPAWDMVDMENYRSRWLSSNGYFSLNIGTTRGCPFKCNWCAKPIYGNRYNARSPKNVVEELSYLYEQFKFDHIWFCDDIFGLKPGWVKEFADLLEERNLVFKFNIQSRADLLLEENNIVDLARAGAYEVWIGAESGSQKILDAMDKGTKVEQIVEATQLMKKHGIKPCYFLQFGYPGENAQDIDSTLELVFSNMPHDIGISVSYPLPGTKFYESVKNDLGLKQNWTDSDELLVMFNSTFPASYYKQLQRHVHYSFRKRQALSALKLPRSLGDLKKILSLGYRIPQTVLSKLKLRHYV